MRLRPALTLLAATGLLLAAATAQASAIGDVLCSDAMDVTGSAGYVSCQGPSLGTMSAAALPLVSFPGFGDFAWAGATNDASGVFSADPAGNTWGALSLAAPRSGPFVVGLAGDGSVSLYLFDGGTLGGASLNGLDWDTYGLFKSGGGAGPLLSHAALYLPATPVPEPASLALLLAGLGGMGLFVRRRRAD